MPSLSSHLLKHSKAILRDWSLHKMGKVFLCLLLVLQIFLFVKQTQGDDAPHLGKRLWMGHGLSMILAEPQHAENDVRSLGRKGDMMMVTTNPPTSAGNTGVRKATFPNKGPFMQYLIDQINQGTATKFMEQEQTKDQAPIFKDNPYIICLLDPMCLPY